MISGPRSHRDSPVLIWILPLSPVEDADVEARGARLRAQGDVEHRIAEGDQAGTGDGQKLAVVDFTGRQASDRRSGLLQL